jgi:hypothetical protein
LTGNRWALTQFYEKKFLVYLELTLKDIAVFLDLGCMAEPVVLDSEWGVVHLGQKVSKKNNFELKIDGVRCLEFYLQEKFGVRQLTAKNELGFHVTFTGITFFTNPNSQAPGTQVPISKNSPDGKILGPNCVSNFLIKDPQVPKKKSPNLKTHP